MLSVSEVMEFVISRPYCWRENDCVGMVERLHNIERPPYMHWPESVARFHAIEEYGCVAAAYEAWLEDAFDELDPQEPRQPGDIAVIDLPPPLDGTVAIVDNAYMIRIMTIEQRLITMESRHRIRSFWRIKGA